jgi:hypothetical protein
MNINNNIYTIKFVDDNSIINTTQVYIYKDKNCDANLSLEEQILLNQFSYKNLTAFFEANTSLYCKLLNILTESEIL